MTDEDKAEVSRLIEQAILDERKKVKAYIDAKDKWAAAVVMESTWIMMGEDTSDGTGKMEELAAKAIAAEKELSCQ